MYNRKIDFLYKLWNEYSHFKEHEFNFDVNEFTNLQSQFIIGESYYYVFDISNFKILYCSEEYYNMYPFAKEPKYFKDVLSIIHPDDISFMNFSETWGLEQILNKNEKNLYKLGYIIRCKVKDNSFDLFYHQTYYEFSNRGKVKYCIHFITRFRHIIATMKYTVFLLNKKNNAIVEKFHFELSNNIVFNSLTNREVEILGFIQKGLSDKQIANVLHISFNTVRTHHKNLNKKTGAKSPADLLRITKQIDL